MSIRLLVKGTLVGLGLTMAAPAGSTLAQALSCNHPSGVGCFEVTVTSGTGGPAQVAGFAKSFGSNADQAWYVQLIEPGGASSIMLLYSGAGLPPTAEHAVADFMANDAEPPPGEFVATGALDPQSFMVSGFHSVGGTLVITASSSSWVEGTFNYRAREASTGQVVTVDGRFKAMNEAM